MERSEGTNRKKIQGRNAQAYEEDIEPQEWYRVAIPNQERTEVHTTPKKKEESHEVQNRLTVASIGQNGMRKTTNGTSSKEPNEELLIHHHQHKDHVIE